jgi:hypothetical protein
MVRGLSQKQTNHCPIILTPPLAKFRKVLRNFERGGVKILQSIARLRARNSAVSYSALVFATIFLLGFCRSLSFGLFSAKFLLDFLPQVLFLGSSPRACFWPFFSKFSFGLFAQVSFWDF